MSLSRLAVFLVTVATLAATWLVLPPPVGVGLRLVAVQGSSMVPTLQPGDLVVVMPSESYLPGQVVAYRSDMLGGAVLLHRVQGYDAGGRLITRGDANGFDDSDRPRPQQVMGVMKMRLPLAGKYLQAVPQPPVAASIAGGAIAAAVAMGSGRKRRQLVLRPAPVLGGLAAGALALAVGVALVVAQQVLPPTAEVNRPVAYQHQGQWEYSAPSLAPIYGFRRSGPHWRSPVLASESASPGLLHLPPAAGAGGGQRHPPPLRPLGRLPAHRLAPHPARGRAGGRAGGRGHGGGRPRPGPRPADLARGDGGHRPGEPHPCAAGAGGGGDAERQRVGRALP